MIVAVTKETYPKECRVALVPANVPSLMKAGMEVLVEAGAGAAAGFPDAAYEGKGAKVVSARKELFDKADIVLQVRTAEANPAGAAADLELIRSGQTVIGMADPLDASEATTALAKKGAQLFALELMPRITRAQSMDVLSSMATIAGYKAVLLGSNQLNRIFPMLMTAAGTVAPAKVFVVGAGVAGLQAISTAKRLGAIVEAYDVRPAVKEQVESLGGKFVEMELETGETEDAGGYAKELGEEFYRRQREMMERVVAASHVVVTTAAIPGKKAPILITQKMVEGMAPGSVVVDLAAERGGNCELTKPGEVVDHNGVFILGPLNLATEIPYHASQMYAKNMTTFLLHLVKEGKLELDLEDEITSGTLVTHGGEVVNPRVREALGLAEKKE